MSLEQPSRRRVGPFWLGALLGFGLAIAAVLAATFNEPRYNVEVVSWGEDVSRHGGASVVVRDGRGMVSRQTCRSECDDMKWQFASGDNSFTATVLDPAGRKLAGDSGTYVTSGTTITRWTVAGERKLDVKLSDIERGPVSGFREVPFTPQAPPAE